MFDIVVATTGTPNEGGVDSARDLTVEIVASRGVKAVTRALDGPALTCTVGRLKLTGLADGPTTVSLPPSAYAPAAKLRPL